MTIIKMMIISKKYRIGRGNKEKVKAVIHAYVQSTLNSNAWKSWWL